MKKINYQNNTWVIIEGAHEYGTFKSNSEAVKGLILLLREEEVARIISVKLNEIKRDFDIAEHEIDSYMRSNYSF